MCFCACGTRSVDTRHRGGKIEPGGVVLRKGLPYKVAVSIPSPYEPSHTRLPQHSSCTNAELPAPGATAGHRTSGKARVVTRTTPSCWAPPSIPSTTRRFLVFHSSWEQLYEPPQFPLCSGRAAGVTAHMSQHDLGVSRQACPLTFPTLRMHAGSAKRRWGGSYASSLPL